MDGKADIREFLVSRRAKVTPAKAGLPAYGTNRRVSGLRREEAAMLAGISVEYYTRLERGNTRGVSEDVLEVAALPQRVARPPLPFKRRPLFEDTDEPLKVAVHARSFNERVNVIRHEAVRNDRQVLHVRSTRKLQQDERYGVMIDEDTRALPRANREEISVDADVVEGLHPWNGLEGHPVHVARLVPMQRPT